MPRHSPRLIKYAILPSSLVGLIGLLTLGPAPVRSPLDQSTPAMESKEDLKHLEQMRMMESRTYAIEELMTLLAEDQISLSQAAQRFVELNIHSRGFQIMVQSRYGHDSLEANACLMMLRRLRTVLHDDPERLQEISQRLRAEYERTYGEMRNDLDQLPPI